MYTLITGATGGIGKAFAFNLAKKGEKLFLTGRNNDKLTALKTQIEKDYKVSIITFPCDLTSESDRENLLNYIKENNIKIFRLINVAGVDTQKAVEDYSKEKFLFQLKVNCEGTLCLTHGLIGGQESLSEILTISSMSGVSPMPYFALYSASKGMLTSFFTSLHYELKSKVKVTVVLPGGVYTREDIVKEIKTQGLWGKLSAKSPDFVAEKSLKALNKNKVKYIPGFFNRLLNFTMKFLPKSLILTFIARRWKTHQKDAF